MPKLNKDIELQHFVDHIEKLWYKDQPNRRRIFISDKTMKELEEMFGLEEVQPSDILCTEKGLIDKDGNPTEELIELQKQINKIDGYE